MVPSNCGPIGRFTADIEKGKHGREWKKLPNSTRERCVSFEKAEEIGRRGGWPTADG